MVRKKAQRLGQARVHELALLLDEAGRQIGFISQEKGDTVNITIPRDLFERLRNSVQLLDYGLDTDAAFDVERGKHHHKRSHLEELRRCCLAIMYAIAIAERDDKKGVIAEEIGRSQMARIGRDRYGYSARSIEKFHAKWNIHWTEYSPAHQQITRLFLEIVERELNEFYEI